MLRHRKEANVTPTLRADSAEVIRLSVQSLGSSANTSCYFLWPKARKLALCLGCTLETPGELF